MEKKNKMNLKETPYDSTYKPNNNDLKNFPDIQNGSQSLIKGSKVGIQQVGIHNFKLPLKYKKKNGENIELETKITGTVSLESHKKGINMSRIIRTFYEFKDEYIFDKLKDILLKYKNDLNTFNAKIGLHFSYPILLPSLRSNNIGYQYYNVTLEGHINNIGQFKKIYHSMMLLFIAKMRLG